MNYLLLLLLIVLLVSIPPLLGRFLARLFEGKRTFLHPVFSGLERLCYRIGGINPSVEMSWQNYAKALFIFNLIGLVALFLLQIAQGVLPLNPQNFPGLAWPLALNTAISFVTNTNWQAYAGETTMSYFTDMAGLTVQNFLSAATGFCAILVLIRGIIRSETEELGNFWVDLVRSMVYVLLPLAFILAMVLVSQGVIQNLSVYAEATTVEGAHQILPMGPAASQIAIKQIGSNGGGFFNANSAHPFENPSKVSNFLEVFAILLLPASLVFTYGEMLNRRKHAWLLWAVMGALWLGGLALSVWSEHLVDPITGAYPLWEGKEMRFGILDSVIWSTATTATSNGSVNAMYSSLTPLAGGVTLFNMMLGELIFGGVGVGLASMLMFTLLTVFLSGLMVGRTPEYMGKKIEKQEILWVMFAIFIPACLILLGTGFSLQLPAALASLSHKGPHGLSEMLYAFTSSALNNGSAFSGLNAGTDYYNWVLGGVMLIGRMSIILPSLRVAGFLVHKKQIPFSAGTFSTETILFALLLLCVILIVGALTFFPLLSLGPVVEHFLMLQGRSF